MREIYKIKSTEMQFRSKQRLCSNEIESLRATVQVRYLPAEFNYIPRNAASNATTTVETGTPASLPNRLTNNFPTAVAAGMPSLITCNYAAELDLARA